MVIKRNYFLLYIVKIYLCLLSEWETVSSGSIYMCLFKFIDRLIIDLTKSDHIFGFYTTTVAKTVEENFWNFYL